MIIVYIDIVLLVILLALAVFACGYCALRVRRLQRCGQVTILLKPRKVLFSHKNEDNDDELRTVVAYQNPFTGDYCVRKSRVGAKVYVNPAARGVPSPDSGLSDEYEPLNLPAAPPTSPPPAASPPPDPRRYPDYDPTACANGPVTNCLQKHFNAESSHENAVTRTWNWNYTEYQI